MTGLSCKVKVEFDDIQKMIDEVKALQTYKLFAEDDLILVSREEVAQIMANHIKAEVVR